MGVGVIAEADNNYEDKITMAFRPVFIPVLSGSTLVKTEIVEFQWFPGFSVSQKQKSIDSLHSSAKQGFVDLDKLLEISSKSVSDLGVALSAFNLTITTVKKQETFSVECAFQGSKVFSNGGPYRDIFNLSSREAKKDSRLKSSGKLIGFNFYGVEWPLEPATAFYDWIYINALRKHPVLADQLKQYSAFTDIEFNPDRSINCQAYSAALFVALKHRGLLEEAASSKKTFLNILKDTMISNSHRDDVVQGDLLG